MLRATLKSMAQRKLRLVLSGLAVVLGVAFVTGSLVLTDTLSRSFDRLFADAYAFVDVRVTGQPAFTVSEFDAPAAPPTVPADIVDRVAAVPGVAHATGLVEVDGARIIGSDGKVVASFGPPRFGINWNPHDQLIELREGRGPEAPNEIAIDAALAQTAKLQIGDTVGVLTREPRRDFTLVGIFGFAGGRDSFAGVQFVAFTDDVAQQLMLGEQGVWTAIDVTAADGVSPEHLRDAIAAAIGDDYHVYTGDELAAQEASELKEGLSFFNRILLGFAAVSLLVATFLILNTFSIVVAQRIRELALTRALGASRPQIIGSVLLEATTTGLGASACGLAAGIGIGALLASAAATFSSLTLAGLAVPPSTIATAFSVGVLVTVTASLLPAVRASRIPPLAAMRDAATPDRPLTRLSVTGAVVLATGAALLAAGLTGTAGDQTLPAILGGVLAALVGVALLTPLIAHPVVGLLGRVFSWSIPGKLGRLNSIRNPRRTAITASALMIGVALVTGTGVLIASTKTSLSELAENTITADIIIAGEPTGPWPPTFDTTVLDDAAALPAVTAAAGFYRDFGLAAGEPTHLGASNDLAALRQVLNLTATAGTLDRLAPDQVAVDDQTAHDLSLTVGDQVELQPSGGSLTTYQVAGIYEQSALLAGFILPVEATADFAIPQPVLGFVQLSDPAAAAQVRDHIATMLADSPEVSVTDLTAFIDSQLDGLDTILVMIQILLALAIIIAVLGIINTLALSVLERTRELGLLRAVGLSRAATMRMVTVESVVISVFGALLGLAVGTGLGTATARALQSEGIDHLTLPWSQMLTYLLLAALIGVVAAVLPAIRAARTDTLRAIAHE